MDQNSLEPRKHKLSRTVPDAVGHYLGDLGPGPLAASGIENLSMVEWNNLYEIERIEEQPPASYAAGVQ